MSYVFALSSTELGRTSLIEHSINTGEHPPIKQLPRRVPHFSKTKVSQHVQKMLKQGVVTPSHRYWWQRRMAPHAFAWIIGS